MWQRWNEMSAIFSKSYSQSLAKADKQNKTTKSHIAMKKNELD